MRSSAIVYVGIMFSILTVGIICLLTMKSSYADTIRRSLDDSIVSSVEMLQRDRSSKIYVDINGVVSDVPKQTINWTTDLASSEINNFKKDFIAYLTAGLDSRITDLDISIYGADTNVGALSVEVVAWFNYPTGQRDSVSSYKTVILNKYEK